MRYFSIDKCECTNGKNWGVSIFTSGCPYHCEGCHNMSTWAINGGEEYAQETQDTIVELVQKPHISRLSILGGEPLLPQNVVALYELIMEVRYVRPDIDIWLWTGTTFESLWELGNNATPEDKVLDSLGWTKAQRLYLAMILWNVDYLIDGRFVREKKDLTLKWRGSSNQRVLDCAESMLAGKPIPADI